MVTSKNRTPPFLSAEQSRNALAHEKLHKKLAGFVSLLIDQGIDLPFAKKELEYAYIRRILDRHDGNIGEAAKAMGVHRNTLSKRLKEFRKSHQC